MKNASNVSKEYVLLFNTITEAEHTLERLRQELIRAQQQAEELFMESGEE